MPCCVGLSKWVRSPTLDVTLLMTARVVAPWPTLREVRCRCSVRWRRRGWFLATLRRDLASEDMYMKKRRWNDVDMREVGSPSRRGFSGVGALVLLLGACGDATELVEAAP